MTCLRHSLKTRIPKLQPWAGSENTAWVFTEQICHEIVHDKTAVSELFGYLWAVLYAIRFLSVITSWGVSSCKRQRTRNNVIPQEIPCGHGLLCGMETKPSLFCCSATDPTAVLYLLGIHICPWETNKHILPILYSYAKVAKIYDSRHRILLLASQF